MFIVRDSPLRLVLKACLIAGLVAMAQATPLDISHRARALQPGEVVLLNIESSEPLSGVNVRAFEKIFPAFRGGSDKSWRSLIGIDLSTKPDNYRIELVAISKQAVEIIGQYTLNIEHKEFPVRNLTVEPKYVSPPADQLERIQRESALVSGIFARHSTERYWSGDFLRPVPGKASGSFGKRSVFNGKPRSPHSGTDFSATTGTPIKAPNTGRIVLAQELYFAGNTVIIDHGQGLYSYFAHLSKFKVAKGDNVVKGDEVGRVGATGRVTGPHLHWTLRLVESRVDPLSLMEILADSGN